MQFLFMFLTTLALATKAGAMLVRIEQTKAVIDANPIINFSEIQFFSNGALLAVPSTAFSFIYESSGFPAAKCNDGVTETLTPTDTSLYNMCKSSNNDPAKQTMVINLSGVSFDTIKIYNARGFNNPSGFDVGYRILLATLHVFSDTDQLLYSTVFTDRQDVYTINTVTTASASSTNADQMHLASDDAAPPNTDDMPMIFQPTFKPTQVPRATTAPTTTPTTAAPTTAPTAQATHPTAKPSKGQPTKKPSNAPTTRPTKKPTAAPTKKTRNPTAAPTKRGPTAVPSVAATVAPTALATANPTVGPTPAVATDDPAWDDVPPGNDDMSGWTPRE